MRPAVLPLAAALLVAALIYRYFDEIARFLLVLYAAVALAVALNALVRHLPGNRRWLSAAIGLATVAGGVLVLWLGGRLLLDQLRDLLESLPAIQAEVERWLASLGGRTGLPVREWFERSAASAAAMLEGGRIMDRARGAVDIVMFPLIILMGALFALAEPNKRLLVPLVQAVPHRHRDAVRRAGDLLSARLVGWIRGQLLAMLAVGVLATLAFTLIGVPYALLLGVANGLLEFIPIAGPWLGGVPAVIVAAVHDPMTGVWTALAVLAIQGLENSVVTPLAMAEGAKIHPFVTLFSLLLFGLLFGFLGILLAVPLLLLAWTVVQVFWVEETLHAGGEKVAPLVKE